MTGRVETITFEDCKSIMKSALSIVRRAVPYNILELNIGDQIQALTPTVKGQRSVKCQRRVRTKGKIFGCTYEYVLTED